MSRKLIRDEQAERWKKFPPDRICFAHSMESANADMQCFRAYMAGQMPMTLLCLCIANNNYLPEVTEEQMMNELGIIGELNSYHV